MSVSRCHVLRTTRPTVMNRTTPLRIGTRSSALARWQAEWVSGRLTEAGVENELVFISTQGDVKSEPLGQIGGQGLFTKEIQRALLDDRVDLAVHSLKDLPTEPIDGLTLGAVPPRERTGDALVCEKYSGLDELPAGARVGTGSARRKAQLLAARPDLEVLDIRGNVDTRLQKLDDGEYDAIILAEAGLVRLGKADRIRQLIPREIMLPAVGQGALGLETRAEDSATLDAVAGLDDAPSRAAVTAERSLLFHLRAGCLAPVGAWARIEDNQLALDSVVLTTDGSRRLQHAQTGDPGKAAELGEAVAKVLIADGAAELIASSRS